MYRRYAAESAREASDIPITASGFVAPLFWALQTKSFALRGWSPSLLFPRADALGYICTAATRLNQLAKRAIFPSPRQGLLPHYFGLCRQSRSPYEVGHPRYCFPGLTPWATYVAPPRG